MKDNLSRLSLLSLFSPYVLFTPRESPQIASTLICCAGCFELRHFLLVVVFLVLWTTTVFKRLSMAPLCEWQSEGLHSLLWPPHGDPQMHLQDQYTTSALWMTLLQLQRVTICVLVEPMWMFVHGFGTKQLFAFSSFAAEQKLLTWSQIEADVKTLRHGECSWTLTVTTAVDVSISALYLTCLVRVITCTAKKEICPPMQFYSHKSAECQPSWTILCFWTPNTPIPMPREWPRATVDLSRGRALYCTTLRLLQKKRLVQCWWKNEWIRGSLPCWLTAGPRREAAANQRKRAGFMISGCVCRDQRSPARRIRRTKIHCFLLHCVQNAERDVEYQNDPRVEDVITVLHDPLQVDCPSLIWPSVYKCFILISHFWTLTDTNMWNTYEVKNTKSVWLFWFKGCTGLHGCVWTCLLFLCLFTFWISQSRLQMLLFLVEN